MKKNFIYGLMIAVAMFMSGASLASPVDTVFGMASSPDYGGDGTAPCVKVTDNNVVSMASCRTSMDEFNLVMQNMTIDESFHRTSTSLAYYQVNNTKMIKTVFACGFVSEYDDVPTKIPILI